MKNAYLQAVEKYREGLYQLTLKGIQEIRNHRGCAIPPDTLISHTCHGVELKADWSVRMHVKDYGHVCGGQPVAGYVNVKLPNGSWFEIIIEEMDITQDPTLEEMKAVLDALLDALSSSAVENFITDTITQDVVNAIKDSNWNVLSSLSGNHIDCSFGPHFVDLIVVLSDSSVHYKLDIDDPEGLFFNGKIKSEDTFYSAYMRSIHSLILMGAIHTYLDIDPIIKAVLNEPEEDTFG